MRSDDKLMQGHRFTSKREDKAWKTSKTKTGPLGVSVHCGSRRSGSLGANI